MVKYIPHLVKGPMETIGWRGVGCAHIFLEFFLHGWQFLTALIQSLNIVGQKYLMQRIVWEVARSKR